LKSQSHTKSKFTRRSFVSSLFLGTAGYWACCSNQLGARVFRGIVAETGRGIHTPKTPKPAEWNDNTVTAAWLGHSTVLINFFGLKILTDPVLFRRVGANLRIGTVGPKRLVAPALSFNQLPDIDVVLLSHAHMDHFDMATLRCFRGNTQAITAASTADLLRSTRLHPATELAWGEKATIRTPSGELAITAFPVRHWGARWRRDSYRGYAGYMLAREGKKIIFGGDTAFCDSFAELRSQGKIEAAIMPIGAYKPWIQAHCTPEQAANMANAAGARYILPIHHKTFPLGREGPIEPIERMQLAVENERLGWRDVGETFELPG
jgi:L-ascorbate metabolism protein UlaG (beta-lactamase superfamily)